MHGASERKARPRVRVGRAAEEQTAEPGGWDAERLALWPAQLRGWPAEAAAGAGAWPRGPCRRAAGCTAIQPSQLAKAGIL